MHVFSSLSDLQPQTKFTSINLKNFNINLLNLLNLNFLLLKNKKKWLLKEHKKNDGI